jgi:dephospho-CoA kinase
MDNFYLIGLTGNLGTGKSTVRRMLEDLGAMGLDADKLARAAVDRGTRSWNAVVDAFGVDILHFDGSIDRQKLADRVFGNPEALRRLETIIHPMVGEMIRQTLRESSSPVVVVEAIKLVEGNLHQWCDALWVVTSPLEMQVQRVMVNRQTSAEDARARLASQSSQDDKVRLADVVIDNGADLAATRAQVEEAWRKTVHPDRARDKSEWLYGRPRSVSESKAQTTIKPAPPTPSEALPPVPLVETEPQVTPPPIHVPTPAQVEVTPSAESTTPPEPSAIPEPALPEPTPPAEVPLAGVEIPEPVAAPSPEPPAPVTMEIEVRRARRTDLPALGVALAEREGLAQPLTRVEVIKRFGERGYRIAIGQGHIVALMAWEAENLVAVVRDIWVQAPELGPQTLPPLFSLVEEDARGLNCEASLIILGDSIPDYISDQLNRSEYQKRDLPSLHRDWRHVVEDRLQPGEQIWAKTLREDRVAKPV